MTNGLFGLGKKENHNDQISNSEIMKLIILKEKKQFQTVLDGLLAIEEQYGPSPRLIHERALCLMELGKLSKARRCIKDFLISIPPDKQNDTYCLYCKQLIFHKDSPLTLENINERNAAIEASFNSGK